MLKKWPIWLSAFFIVVVATWGAFSYQKSLVVTLHPWPGYESFHLAKRFGWFPENILIKEVDNASESLALLRSGKAQIAAITLDEALALRGDGLDISIIAVLDESVGADVVLSKVPLENLTKIKGKRIALEGNTVSNIVLSELLREAQLFENEVKLEIVPPNKQLNEWSYNTFDLVVTFEPFATYLERKGAVRLYDSSEFPNRIYDVLVVRNDAIWFRGKVIDALLEGHFKALRYLRVNQEDALRRIAAWRMLSYEQAIAVYSGLYLPDIDSNKRMLSSNSRFYEAMEQESTMIDSKVALTESVLKSVIQPVYIKRIGD